MARRGRPMSYESFYFYVEDLIDSFIRSERSSCETCEFNFDGICSDAYYGEEITDFQTIRDCWSISLDEYTKRFEQYEKEHDIEKIVKDGYELYSHVKSGVWSFKNK